MFTLSDSIMSVFSKLIAAQYAKFLLPHLRIRKPLVDRESFFKWIEEGAKHGTLRGPDYPLCKMIVIPDPSNPTEYVSVLRDYEKGVKNKPPWIPTTVFIAERERICFNFCGHKLYIQSLMGDHYAGNRLSKCLKRIRPQIRTLRVRGGWKLVEYQFPDFHGNQVVREWVRLNSRLLKAWKILKENATQQKREFRKLVPPKLWRPYTVKIPLNQ